MKLTAVITMLLGAAGHTLADCYPGDTNFTSIVQEIYQGVTSDNITLTDHNITRHALCDILTRHHNDMKNSPHQQQTNGEFLGSLRIDTAQCVDSLTNTMGYNNLSDWNQWAGYHYGYWYHATQKFSADALWRNTQYYGGDGRHQYLLQSVRYDSLDRIRRCNIRDWNGATCRHGWNQSALGVQYIWGWDPKDNGCTFGGRRGTRVGFPFSKGGASCIVWVTTEEAFLECVRKGRRTSINVRSGSSRMFGQWTIDV